MKKLYAEHIIGLTAREMANPDDPRSARSVRERYEEIVRGGALEARGNPRDVGQDGGTFELDHLAGDGQYVFLSCGPRYRQHRPDHLCYGFVFDAAHLVYDCNALVGPDLLDDYEWLLDETVEEVAAALPPLPPISDEELARYADLIGDDPAMLAFVQAESTSRYHDIDRAVRMGDWVEPGAQTAARLFAERAALLQGQKRVSGAAAHAVLRPGMEILVPVRLPLDLAVARIEAEELVRL